MVTIQRCRILPGEGIPIEAVAAVMVTIQRCRILPGEGIPIDSVAVVMVTIQQWRITLVEQTKRLHFSLPKRFEDAD